VAGINFATLGAVFSVITVLDLLPLKTGSSVFVLDRKQIYILLRDFYIKSVFTVI
jgi:hypothetical protein